MRAKNQNIEVWTGGAVLRDINQNQMFGAAWRTQNTNQKSMFGAELVYPKYKSKAVCGAKMACPVKKATLDS